MTNSNLCPANGDLETDLARTTDIVKKDWRWAAAVAVLAMALTMIPYLIGYSMSKDRQFMWLGYNLDDSCVYLSWMRQAADGATRTLNLFTTDAQHGMAPNPFFWLLGFSARMTHLPLLAVYHVSRLICGFGLLLTIWRLIRLLIQQRATQRLSFLLICFSAGLGWLPFWRDDPHPPPIDMWQPEAITFLSLYLSPLFCFSMTLQVALVVLLLLGERAGRMSYGVYAGVCGFVLSLTHTYDIITMSFVWLLYLLVYGALRWRQHVPARDQLRSWYRALIAAMITAPAVAYIAYQLKTETVFRQRAEVATLSPLLWWVLVGYGFLVILAVAAAYAFIRPRYLAGHQRTEAASPSKETPPYGDGMYLLITWAIANIACSYLPVAFQRKMLQGAHIPIALLAGMGAVYVFERLSNARAPIRFVTYAVIVTLLVCPTNLLFMRRDIENYSLNMAQTKLHRTYLQHGEIQALEWVRDHTPPGTAIQPLPWVGVTTDGTHRQIYARDTALMCFTPGLIDRPVYCGHWGETPDFRTPDGRGKLSDVTAFGAARYTDEERLKLLHAMRVRYLIFSQKQEADTSSDVAEETDNLLPIFRGRLPVPTYLRLCYSNTDADVYEYVPPVDANRSAHAPAQTAP